MKTAKALTLLLVGLLLTQPVLAVQDYVTFSFSNTDIKDVVKTIARSTGSNIITEKSVSGKITLSLKDVYYERALELVAKTNGYVVRKIENTYVVGPAKSLAEGFDVGLNRTYKLNFADAESVSKVISGIFKKQDVPIEVSIDERVNAVVVSGNQTALDKIDELVKSIDVPVHQVMIEAKLVEITTDGKTELGFSWKWGRGTVGNLDEGSEGALFAIQEYQKKLPEYTTMAYSGGTAPGGENSEGPPFKFGDFFRQGQVYESAFSAVETTTNGKLLANPKIMAMNGKEAQVQIGEQVIYSGGATQPPQEKDVGTMLKITPRINDEGWVTLELEPTVSEAYWRKLEGSSTFSYPAITKRTAKTTVRVRDGEEILIGGLIYQTESHTERKVPILGDVPLLKTFFTHRTPAKKTRELIILITPHVVQQLEG